MYSFIHLPDRDLLYLCHMAGTELVVRDSANPKQVMIPLLKELID